MKTLLGVPILAFLLAFCAAGTADASWCGAAKFRFCADCCDTVSYCCCRQQCTVMKTCKEVVYEKQNYTCYKTCYEQVCEPRTINCVGRRIESAATSAPGVRSCRTNASAAMRPRSCTG